MITTILDTTGVMRFLHPKNPPRHLIHNIAILDVKYNFLTLFNFEFCPLDEFATNYGMWHDTLFALTSAVGL